MALGSPTTASVGSFIKTTHQVMDVAIRDLVNGTIDSCWAEYSAVAVLAGGG